MTPAERTELEARLSKAKAAERRVADLSKAVEGLAPNSEVCRVNVLLVEGQDPVMYSTTSKSDGPWYVPCCGLDREAGIVAEFRAAMLAILERRLTEARSQLEAA